MAQEFDSPEKLEEKVVLLCQLLSSAQHVVVHTGAGVSTSAGLCTVRYCLPRLIYMVLHTCAGIPDFRGPRGVWTLEKRGRRVETNVTFEDAQPTLTHQALVGLVEAGIVKYVVSQNVDGLHLKSGIPRYSL